jgi:segregation and condensation protein A
MEADYKAKLEVFEGPLDLLLYLIKKEEVDIYDIPIEKITTQYMENLSVMQMLNLEMVIGV